MRQFAVAKNFEIIGEAAYHLTKDLIDNNPQIEWQKIIAFRHVLIHEYYQVNLQLIWNVIVNKLAILDSQIITLKTSLTN